LSGNYIERRDDEPYFNTVARAITSPMTTAAYVDSATTDYHRLDVSEVMLVCANEVIPLVQTFSRREDAAATKHEWFEQYIPDDAGTVFLAETADPAAQVATVPTRFSNTMAKMGRLFIMSDEAQVIAQARGLHAVGVDEFARQMSIQTRQLVRDTEKALIEAVESTSSPRGFRGILGAYKPSAGATLNGWIGGVVTATTLDLGGDKIVASGATSGQRNVEDVLNQFMLQLYLLFAGPMPNTLYVPPRFLKIMQDAASAKIQINLSQDDLARQIKYNLGGATGKFYTNFGLMNVVAHPRLLGATATPGSGDNVPAASRLLALETNSFSIIDYVNNGGFRVEQRAKTGPTDTRLISQYLTLEVRNLNSHGCIKNFWF